MVKKYSLLVFAILFFFTPATFAQEIVVEASKIRQEDIEASRSVTVVSEATLARQRATSVVDILRAVPGVEVIRQGGYGQTASVFIRGARSEDTLVLIDGMEANDAMAPSRGFDFSTLSANQVARIEVYRGPQSVRFGSGALGGVINIVTKEGQGPRRSTYLIEGGSYDTVRVALDSAGNDGTRGYSLGAEGYQSHGFSAASENSGNQEPDGVRALALAAKGVWQPDRAQKWEGTLRYTNAAVDLDRRGGPGGDDPNFTSVANQVQLGVKGSDRFWSDRLYSNLGFFFLARERTHRNFADAMDSNDSGDRFLSQNQKIESSHELTLGESHRLRADLQWRGESGSSHSLFNGSETRVPKKSQSLVGEGLTYLYEDEIWFGDVGVRSDQPSNGQAIPSTRLSLGRTLGTRRLRSFLSYGTGFKTPSFYQLYSIYGNQTLRHENSRTWEFTSQFALTPQSSLTGTYFDSHFRDLIDFDLNANRFFNVDRARSKGVELLAQIHFEVLDLVTAYSYVEAVDETTGRPLVRRPKNSVRAELRGHQGRLEGFVQGRYTDVRADVDPVTFARITNRASQVVDVGFEYSVWDNLKIKTRVDNLFNQRYEEVVGYGTARLSAYVGLVGEM